MTDSIALFLGLTVEHFRRLSEISESVYQHFICSQRSGAVNWHLENILRLKMHFDRNKFIALNNIYINYVLGK